VSERTATRPPVRPRSGRRPLPPLIFLLVLAVAAGVVWLMVVRQDRSLDAAQARACASADEAPPSLEPGSVSVRVFNATDSAGLAQQVAEQLQARGLVVSEVANDPSEREVEGSGEVRFGARGQDQARYLTVFLPGAGMHQDTRATAVVDLVLGPEFSGLAGEAQVAETLAAAQDTQADC